MEYSQTRPDQLPGPPIGTWIHSGMNVNAQRAALTRAENDAHSLWHLNAGTLWLHAPGKKRQRLPQPSGIWLAPGDGMAIETTVGAEWNMLRFDLTPRRLEARAAGKFFYAPAADQAPQAPPHHVLGQHIPTRLPDNLLLSLQTTLTHCCGTSHLSAIHWWRANCRLGLWIADLLEYLNDHGAAPLPTLPIIDPPPALREDAFVQRVTKIINRHLANGLAVEQLAHLVGISRQHLALRLRTSALPMSPSGLIHFVAMQRAIMLLTTKDQTIADIATFCGFRSQSSFTAKFKKQFGMTPSLYKS